MVKRTGCCFGEPQFEQLEARAVLAPYDLNHAARLVSTENYAMAIHTRDNPWSRSALRIQHQVNLAVTSYELLLDMSDDG